MKRTVFRLMAVVFLALSNVVLSQGTAFTYQGRLNDGINPANGFYDLRFSVYDAAGGGSQQGSTVTNVATSVSNGLFTVTLDFGNQFPGGGRWLEIGVRTNGGGSFTTLTPRQPLTATPYAIQSANAATAGVATSASSVAAGNVVGTLTSAQLPASVVTNGATGVNLVGTFSGNGSGLTGVPGTLPWQTVPGVSVSAVANRGYFLNNDSLTTVALPTSASISDTIAVSGVGSNGWRVITSYVQPTNVIWTAQNSGSQSWKSVASSADGNKLVAVVNGGQIYTSADSGLTWTPQTNGLPSNGVAFWYGVASSADGSKLAAVVFGGQIYTSTNSGATWSAQGSPTANWDAVASSADGTKLIAAVYFGNLYTSTNSGATWQVQTNAGSQAWGALASSADGNQLAAAVYQGRVYLSTNAGVAWTVQTNGIPQASWTCVSISADGTKLAAGASGAALYTSTNSGANWNIRPSSGFSSYWSWIAASAVGDKLVAVSGTGGGSGTIMTSTDFGSTWTVQTNGAPNAGNVSWQAVASSADGGKVVAVASGTPICTAGPLPVFFNGAPGTTTEFQYLGNGIWRPLGAGANQIVGTISAANLPATLVTNGQTAITLSGTFNGNGGGLTNVPGTMPLQVVSITNIQAQPNQAYGANSASPASIFLPGNANVGDVVEIDGLGAGGWQALASGGQFINGLQAGLVWMAQPSPVNNWIQIASSADGNKLVGATPFDAIYTSTNGGAAWTPRPVTNDWRAIASSADGSTLVAATRESQIYNSTNGGVTWTARPYSGPWISVAGSADGTKFVAAMHQKFVGGPIYTSADSGATWTLRPFTNFWNCIASSADGSKLVGVTRNQRIYTSVDAGTNWTPRPYTNLWTAVASSADGTKLVAVATFDAIYTSVDSGATWTPRPYTNEWTAVASSTDGSKLAAATYGGQIFVSFDSGVTWSARGPVADWISVKSSADGSRFIAASQDGQIYGSTSLSLTGGQGASVTLQYLGNGSWQATRLPETSASLPNTVVTRDNDGNVTANSITATSFYGNATGLTGVALLAAANTFSNDQAITAQNTLEFGAGVGGKEANAGKIGYQVFSDGLDIVGAGTNGPDRKIQFWAEGGSTFAGPVNATSFNGDGSGLSSLNTGQFTGGTLADARLSSNVALRSGGNNFTNNQSVTSGNLGIGTTTPNYPLTFSSTLGNKISLYESGSGNHYGFGVQSFQLQIHTDTAAADVVFGSGQSTNLNETMRVKGTKNVGIGTADPHANTLQINTNYHFASGYALQANKADYGANIQINRPAGQAGIGLVVDNSANGDANTHMLLVRNNVATFAQDLFTVRADGNVGIGTSGPTNKLHVAGGVSATAFVTTSDRNAKENFAPVSPQEVLNKVAALPITTWNFKTMKDGRHMGPMAQDFYAAFGLGGGDTTITSMDPDGVALAAIQGLNQKLEETRVELKRRNAENAELRQRMERLEKALLEKSARHGN